MPLDVQIQSSWAAGSFLNPSRELIPKDGFARATNALLEEDGTVYKRGGSAYLSSANFGASLRFIFDGYLTGGQRTLFASSANFGVLDADGTTNLTLGGSGTDGQRPAAGNGLVFVPNGASAAVGTITAYGGSRKTAAYTTGTLTTTLGSTAVVGVGSLWSANVDAGMILVSGGVVLGVVESIGSNTTLTLRDGARAAVAGAAYSAAATYSFTPVGATRIDAVATISNPARLVVCSGGKASFSTAGDPFTFAATDYHRMPQGAQIVGAEALRNVLFVFTTQGVFAISGMDFDLTDALGNIQQRLEQINRDVICWDARGITGWSGALIVPATDDVWLITASAAPRALSVPIRAQYRAYVRAGYQCGQAAVYRNHLLLPILNGTTWVDTLVHRLDQGGWTFWAGHGGTSVGFAQRSAGGATRQPQMLSAGGSRVLDVSGAWVPTGTNKYDADGTTPIFELVTRDYITGGLRKNLVKKIRLRYDLNDAATDSPTVQAYSSFGQVVTGNPLWGAVTWGSFLWGGSTVEQFSQLTLPTPNAPASTGIDPNVWQVIPTESGVRARFVRFKFSSSTPCAKMVVRSLEIFVRPGGRA